MVILLAYLNIGLVTAYYWYAMVWGGAQARAEKIVSLAICLLGLFVSATIIIVGCLV